MKKHELQMIASPRIDGPPRGFRPDTPEETISDLQEYIAELEEALSRSRCPEDHHYKHDIICPRCRVMNRPRK